MSLLQLTDFLDWLNAHPHWVGLIVLLTAMGESLVVVGLIVPGFIMMIGFGALIATGVIDFWPTVIFASVGAFLGDSLSYWLGNRYQQQLASVWPLSRYPHLLQKGEDFFQRYGALSIVFGRFFGPLRAIVPAIAGISNMPRVRFFFANSISAMAWAPLYLLPGILFGLSIELAQEFAGQLAVFVIIVFVLFIACFLIIKFLYTWIAPKTDILIQHLLQWGRRHPHSGQVTDALLNSQHSEIRALTLLGFILLAATMLYLILTQWLFNASLFGNLDLLTYNNLQASHLPVLTTLLKSFALLGERISIVVLYCVLVLYFISRHAYSMVIYSLAALLLPWLTASLIDLSYYQSFLRPSLPDNAVHQSSLFFIDVAALGFASVLLARNVDQLYRWLIYLSFSIFIFMIALAQLYFGIQWLSEIVAGLLLGIIWVSILSIAYRCHISHRDSHNVFSMVLVLSLAASPFAITQWLSDATDKLYIKPDTYLLMSNRGWQESGWQIVAKVRHDLRARNAHPFVIQWLGKDDTITRNFIQAGWKPVKNSSKDYLRWIAADPDPAIAIKQLPILPHVHDGRYSQLHFSKVKDNKLYIARLWRSNYLLQKKTDAVRVPLWLGTVTQSYVERNSGLSYLVTDDFNYKPVIELQKSLASSTGLYFHVNKKPDSLVILISNK